MQKIADRRLFHKTARSWISLWELESYFGLGSVAATNEKGPAKQAPSFSREVWTSGLGCNDAADFTVDRYTMLSTFVAFESGVV